MQGVEESMSFTLKLDSRSSFFARRNQERRSWPKLAAACRTSGMPAADPEPAIARMLAARLQGTDARIGLDCHLAPASATGWPGDCGQNSDQ
jgi:hypothetical protein